MTSLAIFRPQPRIDAFLGPRRVRLPNEPTETFGTEPGRYAGLPRSTRVRLSMLKGIRPLVKGRVLFGFKGHKKGVKPHGLQK